MKGYPCSSGRNVLVAGGTGLVGANLAKRLKEMGAAVRATYFTRIPPVLDESYKRYDLTKFGDCIEATRDMDDVFICAAYRSGAKMMKEHPSASILPNLKISAGLLEACRLNKIEKVILISSSTVYQAADYPVREEELDLNKPPYELYLGIGGLNRYIEQLGDFYHQKYGMRITIVRPSSIYGPYDRFEGEGTNVIPALIKKALDREDPYVVWGDGNAVRDFIYVDDFVDDLLCVAKLHCSSDPVNIGSGSAMRIREAVGVILKVCGHYVVPIYDRAKPTAIPYRGLGIRKLECLCGKRNRTLFEEGIGKTVEWYKTVCDEMDRKSEGSMQPASLKEQR